jgi:hypothetical protein
MLLLLVLACVMLFVEVAELIRGDADSIWRRRR